MSRLNELLRTLRSRAGKREVDQQVDAELTHHFDMLVEENIAAGMSAEAARASAEERFGDYEEIRKRGARVRRGNERARQRASLIDTLVVDLRFAFRGLHRNPGFAAVAVLTLALGIGAGGAALSVLDAVLLRPLPFDEPDRLVKLQSTFPDGDRVWFVSPADLIDWRERNRVFTGLSAIDRGLTDVFRTDGQEALQVIAARVSTNFFDVLGVDAVVGRTLVSEDDAPGAPRVAVLNHGLWLQAFGGDPQAVGRTVRLGDERYTVVGVLPRDFAFREAYDGDGPVLWAAGALPPERRAQRRNRSLDVVARLRPGVSLRQAQDEMQALALDLAEEYPATNKSSQTGNPFLVRITSVHDKLVEDVRTPVLMLSGAVGFVLLIAWLNVTNLLLARTTARRRELSLRTAIGAGSWRVGRQLITETMLLTSLGGVLGLVIAWWLTGVLVTVAPEAYGGMSMGVGVIPLLYRAEITGWVLRMTLLTCLVTVAACGLAPAIRAARTDPGDGLKGSSGHERTMALMQQANWQHQAYELGIAPGLND